MRLHTTLLSLLLAALAPAGTRLAADEPIRICATTPDLGDLARAVGGDLVDVTVFTKGPQDPHDLEARPSLIRALHAADLFLYVGLDLEIGWAPELLRSARNPRVRSGGEGHFDASNAITPLERASGLADRSLGDVHARGNPHYLVDPLSGLKVAKLLRDRLARLRPDSEATFAARYRALEEDVLERLLGERLYTRYVEKERLSDLVKLLDKGTLPLLLEVLEKQGERELLGGWLGAVAPIVGAKVVADHNLWPYFARRFGIRVIGFMEPKPGIAPTTRHLAELIERMETEKARAILSSPYFSPRHAEFLARRSGAKIVRMSHQTNARDDAGTWIEMIDANVRHLVEALGGSED